MRFTSRYASFGDNSSRPTFILSERPSVSFLLASRLLLLILTSCIAGMVIPKVNFASDYRRAVPMQEETVTLEGYVKNQFGGGVSGSLIVLSGAVSQTTTTNAAGYYGFTVPGGCKEYGVKAYVANAYVSQASIGGCGLSGTIRFGDFIYQEPFDINLYGYVVTPNGEGVAGVLVTLSGEASGATVTGADGRYNFRVRGGCANVVGYKVVATVGDQIVNQASTSGCGYNSDLRFPDFIYHLASPPPIPTPTPTPTPTPAPSPDLGGGIGGGVLPTPTPTLEVETSVIRNHLEAPAEADTRFVNNVFAPHTDRIGRSSEPFRAVIAVGRVIGDGKLNPNGTLLNPKQLVENGVVSEYAILRIPAFDVDSSSATAHPERDRIRFNGVDIGSEGNPVYLTGKDGEWVMNEFKIPIELVKFPAKVKEGEGLELPIPVLNEVTINVNEADETGAANWSVAFSWMSLEIQALAPIIMVHGNNSDSKFWEDFNFTQPFINQRVSFDHSLTMETDSIEAHGDLLRFEIPKRASKFGAKHVHLIAHSKGGLDSRQFLARTVPANFGVLSLTTLGSPHHGSVGADFVLDASDPLLNLEESDAQFIAVITAAFSPPDKGTPNLRTSYLKEKFNPINLPKLPREFMVDGETTPVSYYSFAADGNLDDSDDFLFGSTITYQNPNEIRGFEEADKLPHVFGDLSVEVTLMHGILGNFASTRLEKNILGLATLKTEPTTTFEPNDFLVTEKSARLPTFTSIPTRKDNHATLANPAVGNQVLEGIKKTQPVR